MRRSRSALGLAFILMSLISALPPLNAGNLTFKKALELASAHSSNVGIAVADQLRAQNSYLEARNVYIPSVIAGSGLGASWGFPLSLEGSAPSIFNVVAQSTVYNPSQRSFLKAARSEWNAMGHNADDQRDQAMLDAAVTYVQLSAVLVKLDTLKEQTEQAKRAEFISQQRLQQGLDSKADLTRANLNSARTRLRLADAQGAADLLVQHMCQLTGLAASDVQLDPASVPPIPGFDESDALINRVLANSFVLKMAEERQRSKELQAKAEHNALYPSIDFAAQYALLAKYNNYEEFYKSFQRNNATVGVAIKIPFLNPVQRAKSQTAAAELMRAKAETDATRNQIASQALKLQRSLQQLAAARDVAKLEWELAQTDLDAVGAKMQAGNATLKDQENARVEVSDKYAAYLDTSFEYDKARLQLMSLTGELRQWLTAAK